jgi:hypothetical protein
MFRFHLPSSTIFFSTLALALLILSASFDIKHIDPNSQLILLISSGNKSFPYIFKDIVHLYPVFIFLTVFSSNEKLSIDNIGGIFLRKNLNHSTILIPSLEIPYARYGKDLIFCLNIYIHSCCSSVVHHAVLRMDFAIIFSSISVLSFHFMIQL